MTIYALYQSYQEMDSDGYQHWLETMIISYHMTQELAEGKIPGLLEKDIEEFKEGNADLIPHNGQAWFDKRIMRMKKNMISIAVGTGDKKELHNIYFVNPIEVEDDNKSITY
jgi:hypothetical protein